MARRGRGRNEEKNVTEEETEYIDPNILKEYLLKTWDISNHYKKEYFRTKQIMKAHEDVEREMEDKCLELHRKNILLEKQRGKIKNEGFDKLLKELAVDTVGEYEDQILKEAERYKKNKLNNFRSKFIDTNNMEIELVKGQAEVQTDVEPISNRRRRSNSRHR